VLTTALYERFSSRGEADFQDKLLSAMRFQFGGHLESFLLSGFDTEEASIALLNWDDLKPTKTCPYNRFDHVLGISDKNILFFTRASTWRSVEISVICGASQSSFNWEGPVSAALVGDSDILLAGYSPWISLVHNGKVLWTSRFDKKNDVVDRHVEVSAGGQFLAVAVRRFGGGSSFLDISRKLKAVRVIVYRTSDGSKLLEVPVNPNPSAAFDFALSPSGDTLAVLSDEFLEIAAVRQ
jgi:hypothetical protein